ncbi:unnamed protein product [Rotaria magnacalcarata]
MDNENSFYIDIIHVKVSNDFLNELECVVNHTLANIIRQSNSLGVNALDLFDKLITDARQSKLHHQESIYVSNAISSSQACLIQQSSEEQQYRSSQDFISHCGDYESVARIQLNHRKKEEDKKAAVSTKPSAPNFMAIMEQAAKYGRDKIHPQSESENNDESSQWNDSNCERCEEFERHKNKFKWICCDTTVTTGSEVGGCKNGNMASMKIPQMDNIEMEAILIKRWEEECRRNQEYNERWLLLLENRS